VICWGWCFSVWLSGLFCGFCFADALMVLGFWVIFKLVFSLLSIAGSKDGY
jgi:hypothetical protein